MSEYIAVRTSAYFTNLFHAALPSSKQEDGTYRAVCGVRRPMHRYIRHSGRTGFFDTDEAFRCRKCIMRIERLENPPPAHVIETERAVKRQVRQLEQKRARRNRRERLRDAVSRSVTAADLFEVERFAADVNAYRTRQHMTWHDVAVAASIAEGVTNLGTSPSLRTVLALAEVCDLSVDAYRINQIR